MLLSSCTVSFFSSLSEYDVGLQLRPDVAVAHEGKGQTESQATRGLREASHEVCLLNTDDTFDRTSRMRGRHPWCFEHARAYCDVTVVAMTCFALLLRCFASLRVAATGDC